MKKCEHCIIIVTNKVKNSRGRLIKTIFVLLLLIPLYINCNANEPAKTGILTIGTIHNFHSNSRYSYDDVLNIINTFNPDLICVEIRPEDFRKRPYLREMMLATAYGDINKIPVFPVDWWDDKNNDRQIRDSLGRVDKFIKLLKMNDSLEKNNPVLNEFKSRYGENIYGNSDLDLFFWNGNDYNNEVRESYKISLSVFGDSPFNLHYLTRNNNMLQNIKEGVKKYSAKRVIVLTGGEHKSFFDDSLSADKHFKVYQIDDIKPIKNINQNEFIEKVKPSLYYSKTEPGDADEYYIGMNLPLVHGMGMDMDISKINPENLPVFEKSLRNWQREASGSVKLVYEWAWFYFLNKQYDQGLKYCELYLQAKKTGGYIFGDWAAYRIMGFCYDLKNERDRAVDCYRKAKEEMKKSNMNDRFISLFLNDFESKPFTR